MRSALVLAALAGLAAAQHDDKMMKGDWIKKLFPKTEGSEEASEKGQRHHHHHHDEEMGDRADLFHKDHHHHDWEKLGEHHGFSKDQMKAWKMKYKQANWEAHRNGPDNKAFVCPFLEKIVPKAQGWENRAEDFAAALDMKDAEEAAAVFHEEAVLTVYDMHPHGEMQGTSAKVFKGRADIEEMFKRFLPKLTDVRLKAMYPDFARETALAHLEVFARCPHTGNLHATNHIMDVQEIRDGKVAAAFVYEGGRAGNKMAKLEEEKAEDVKRVSEALSTAVGNNDCSALLEVMGDEVKVELADAYYHKVGGDPYSLDEKATPALEGKAKVQEFCEGWMQHHQRFTPLEFLEPEQSFHSTDGTSVLTGSMAMKVVFSPKIQDWRGAVKVKVCPKTKKIMQLTLYPNEMTGMVEKWAWKYGSADGKGCAMFTKLQRFTKQGIRFTHGHGTALGLSMLALLLSTVALTVFCCCKCCRGRGRKVAARELETPLRDLSDLTVEQPPASVQEPTAQAQVAYA